MNLKIKFLLILVMTFGLPHAERHMYLYVFLYHMLVLPLFLLEL